MPEANSVIALLLLLAAGTGRADVLEIPVPPPAVRMALPDKGSNMSSVVRKHGEPQLRHTAIGGGAPKQPPITRWDYPGFSVFFENEHVVDAVVPTAPATIHHKEELGSLQ